MHDFDFEPKYNYDGDDGGDVGGGGAITKVQVVRATVRCQRVQQCHRVKVKECCTGCDVFSRQQY